jgi:dihydroorotase-like cyclic amidohydrolase
MLVIHGAVVEEDGVHPGCITIEDDHIASFIRHIDRSQPCGSTREVLSFGSYEGKRGIPEFLIFPGFIDLYARIPERLAASNGGVTSIINYGIYVEPGDLVDFTDHSSMIFNISKSIEYTKTIIQATKTYNLRSRIIISTVEELELIRQAKKEGLYVFSEVHPINLYFDTSMITAENERSLRTNPPLRSSDKRKALLQAFAEGHIDIISSGHTPRSLLDPESGVPELDTFGSMMVWLIEEGVPPEVIFRAACFNPSLWISDTPLMIGRIKEGYKANIPVLAFNKPAIDGRQIYTKCGWIPYDLRHFRGSVETVVLNGGKVVNGQWMAGTIH